MADFLRTDDVTQEDRFARWRHWVSATYVPLECAQLDRQPFRGQIASWALGELRVSRVAAAPHLASRTRRMIALREGGYYKVGLLARGSCLLIQDGREALLRPGDLAIYDCRRPNTMSFSEPHDMTFLMFPNDRLQLPPRAVERVLATRVPGRDSTGSLVGAFLRQLVANLETESGSVNQRLAGNVLDLVATLFGERTAVAPADPGIVRHSLLLAVRAWIDGHLSDPGLAPATIAAANHISVRYLHKLFHEEGTTVARWVRARRLERCRRDLEDPALAGRCVQAVARSWGFDDPAHFSKVFKAAYGEPPGEHRRRAEEARALCAAGQ